MKIERTKNASRNFAYGIFYRVYSIFFPFVIRTAIIYLLGVEYVGLNSLYSSILQVLNLAELGVGSAMVFSMTSRNSPLRDSRLAESTQVIWLTPR